MDSHIQLVRRAKSGRHLEAQVNQIIYCDNIIEGNWFKSLSPLLKSAQLVRLASRGSNPKTIDELIRYDRPDIILTIDGEPKLVLEKTREVPTGHNVGQRFARLVRAAELEVPVIAFFPFDARKHGDYTSVCNLNIRLLKAFEHMRLLHKVPVLAVNWPADEHHELIDDGSENEGPKRLIHGFLSTDCDSECKPFVEQERHMAEEYERRLKSFKAYNEPPASVAVDSTANTLAGFGVPVEAETRKALLARAETLTYTMAMTPEKCRREDPYTGTQFIYDYIWCRTGARVDQKHRNLVLHFPRIKRSHWHQKNPNDPGRKSCNWYLTANALVFSDGMDLVRA